MSDPDARRAARVATAVAVPVACVLALLLLWLTTGVGNDGSGPQPGASAAVSVSARTLPTRSATVCRGLLANLPDSVRGVPQRPVTDGAEQLAAYGDPPLLVRCGADPVTVSATSTETVYPLSGVCWFANRRATVWTTLDREVPVSVTVPRSTEEPGQWVAAFSRYVSGTPRGGRPPSGCPG